MRNGSVIRLLGVPHIFVSHEDQGFVIPQHLVRPGWLCCWHPQPNVEVLEEVEVPKVLQENLAAWAQDARDRHYRAWTGEDPVG